MTCQSHLPTLPMQASSRTMHSHLQAGSLKGTAISTALCKTEVNSLFDISIVPSNNKLHSHMYSNSYIFREVTNKWMSQRNSALEAAPLLSHNAFMQMLPLFSNINLQDLRPSQTVGLLQLRASQNASCLPSISLFVSWALTSIFALVVVWVAVILCSLDLLHEGS